MYFSYATKQNNDFPYHYKIRGNWLSTSVDLDTSTLYGYKLGTYGGNFIEFLTNSIKFSFHKDFKLTKNEDFILTNLEVPGKLLDNDTIQYYYDGTVKHYPYEIKKETTYKNVVENFKNILLENIKTLSSENTRIVYTAGLDSGLIAYLAQSNDIKFTAVIQDKYRFQNLPFESVEYFNTQKMPEFSITYGSTNNVKPGFYQTVNNNLITGYYGDLCGLHHNQMYHQSKHLMTTKKKITLYDKAKPEDYSVFADKEEIIFCIKYLNGQSYFRHWFDNFQILDPYRDPRLFLSLLSLKLNDLIIQLGTGMIQKDIVKGLNPKWLSNLCEYKNDYEKFE